MNQQIACFYYGALGAHKGSDKFSTVETIGKGLAILDDGSAVSLDHLVLKLRKLENLTEEELIHIAKLATGANWKKYKIVDLRHTKSALFKVVNYHNEKQKSIIVYNDGTIKKLHGVSQYPLNQSAITSYLMSRYFDVFNLIEDDQAVVADSEDYKFDN